MIQSAPEISEKISVFSEDEDIFITVENQKILGTVFTNNENSENSPEILTSDIRLRGAFHQENILPAIAVAKQFGVENSVIKKCISEFSGLPMRCEKIETENSKKQNIQFFNDSFSTIPETSISAISILKTPLYLILGGSEKNSDFSGLAQAISMNTNIIKVYLVGKTAIKISEELEIHGYDDFLCMKNLEEIFQDFKKEAQSGDSLLLSPACASFGMFKNYKERGERFNELVGKF
ncbi:TPA: hypothetical protein EYP45_01150 [Candidatus Peregrinibacteria bacterium]|nr:hypothetical protein [Candidatus Peregrinibacteria bacterium]